MSAFDAERWRREVMRTRTITDGTRLLLVALSLSGDMNDRGHVQIKRDRMARLIGTSERRCSARIQEAYELGWLDVVQRGVPGRVAIYGALYGGSRRAPRPHGRHAHPNGCQVPAPMTGDDLQHPLPDRDPAPIGDGSEREQVSGSGTRSDTSADETGDQQGSAGTCITSALDPFGSAYMEQTA